ncbi:ABC-2 type transport system ATP-binding protein/lipopolysaccharide transport system ATP-binding protein [Paenibacillus polysaccharolyticus]|uniref:ABC-2 type transport system ATP-binding protein/lipopolysaccharide transport system ATP-binding protein n=1 Tax=Paenibacillus polysaccharolyticus TaxID=582692 RepID=A0A1G5K8C3_9BACL|nr:ABC transporter ATP-binding protein [Paenibacillus polysaccharolyticus]SCY96674.1 ABC-2 type transport system ATP-binding protein/lipopolysaccharide transport system ATP-binding protein [Paenibacillus polysaccharolyticus]
MEELAIKMKNVTMTYKLTEEKIDSFKEFFVKFLQRKIKYKEFYAVKTLNLEIKKGERLGIIGHNGAGKSTLLKLISGVVKPTSGEVIVNGTIAPLLELGAGFDPDLTGKRNIYLNGAILGKSKKVLDEKLKEIIEYADLGEFINVPVKNYSSGMRARLGFAVATQINPDILIVDEILGVGDQNFRDKSTAKMKELINSGKTVLLVSHSLDQIQELTEKVIWLQNGEIKEYGASSLVCENYKKYMSNTK